jgi:hypothetical protein
VTTFRYHVVSIASVFLALAIGLALGVGPLGGGRDGARAESAQGERGVADTGARAQDQRRLGELGDELARRAAPGLVRAGLHGRAVTVLVMPGADEVAVEGVADFVGAAGGAVAGVVRAEGRLVDAGNRQLVDELGAQLLDAKLRDAGVKSAEQADGYERLGALVGRAIGTTTDAGAAVDDPADRILSGLATARLVSSDGDLARRGSLVVLVAGAGPRGEERREGASSITRSLAEAIAASTDGVVVAGPVASARDSGVVDVIRADSAAAGAVSTVDGLDDAAGQVVAVLALVDEARGQHGHYGAADAPDGAMPGSASATTG